MRQKLKSQFHLGNKRYLPDNITEHENQDKKPDTV